jgi:nucleolar protein 9
LTPHATALASSPFGRFFAKKLNLQLLIRRPDEWKEEVIGVRHHFAHQKDAQKLAAKAAKKAGQAEGEEGKPKRKLGGEDAEADEIDDLFAGAKKSKKVRV